MCPKGQTLGLTSDAVASETVVTSGDGSGELDFDDLKIHQLDALAIAPGVEKPPTGKKDVKAAVVRPLFDAHAEQKAAED